MEEFDELKLINNFPFQSVNFTNQTENKTKYINPSLQQNYSKGTD